MAAKSGIEVTPELVTQFIAAVDSKDIRFFKISIQNESLVHDQSIPIKGSLKDDLLQLQDVLDDNTPANVLTRLDDPSSEWLAIFYVPDTAKVRDKMLYASTRTTLMKAFGSITFSDTIFATSKADITPDAYDAHRRHQSAPKPLSLREQEMADIRAAEIIASNNSYEGSRGRETPIRSQSVGLVWSKDLEDAFVELANADESRLIIAKVQSDESLGLSSVNSEVTVETLGKSLPPSDPCYAFFLWPHSHSTPPRRELIFIYSCPSGSPVKQRMVYSLACLSEFRTCQALLSKNGSTSNLSAHRVETSDPNDIDEKFLISQLGLANAPAERPQAKSPGLSAGGSSDGSRGFAKPRGPARKR